jgi:hypothetical protein
VVAGQAQGSHGSRQPATAVWTTALCVEESLEVRGACLALRRRRELAARVVSGVTQGRGGKVHGVPTRVTWEGDVARLARSDPALACCTQGAKLRRAGMRGGDSLSRRRNITNPRTGSPVQHPGRVGEEQTARVVQDHEGGTRGGLATCLRCGHGDVPAGRGLLGSRDSGGAIFGNSNETSYDPPEGWYRGRPRGRLALAAREGG